MIKTKKKTTKVKRKRVKSKKKVVKKKTTKSNSRLLKSRKKKVVKKKKKKKVGKNAKKRIKKKKRRRKTKITMEDIYSILNTVQLSKKKITFAAYIVDAPTIENNIKDVDLAYKKVEMKTQAVFTIFPNETEYGDNPILPLEIMDDEIPDIDQIFG